MNQQQQPKPTTAEKISTRVAQVVDGESSPIIQQTPPPAQLPAEKTQPQTTPAVHTADGFEAYLKRNQREFAMVIPKHVPIDRVIRLALSAVRRSPQLLSCSLPSIMGGIMQATALGLELNSPLRQASLVPFNNKKTGGKDAQIIIEYRGYIDLFYRTGKVQTVYAKEVYANDFFELEYGLNENLIHKPWFLRGKQESGEIIGFYAYAKMKDGAYRFEYLPKSAIDAIRDEYASGYDPNDPSCAWIHDYIAMGKKTLVRRLEPWLPKSAEVPYATQTDYTIVDPLKIEAPQTEPKAEVQQ